MKLPKDLREFIELLNSHKVEYLIVGGHAVAFHGYPRYTGDIDLLVRQTQENVSRVAAAINTFGLSDSEHLNAILMQKGKILQIGRPPNRVDIITSATGIDFDQVWDSAIQGSLDQIPVRFLDLASLLKNKKSAGRTKDLADVEELERLVKRK